MVSPLAVCLEEPVVAIPDVVPSAPRDADTLTDLRFRGLMTAEDWAALPAAIRRRFSKRLPPGGTVVYAGAVLETRITWQGRVFGNLARIIGAPLPLSRDAGVPAIVTVTEDLRSGGQVWTRQFSRRNRFPQVIHTAKRFAGVTGLEEYAGRGVSMALTVHAVDGQLVFRSTGYWLQIGSRRFRIPDFLTPGRMVVTHAEVGGGRFTFTLQVVHPRFGEIIRQSAMFSEVVS